MPRAPRIEFAGAIYHVMSRGDHLEPIVRDDKDREMFLKTLEETCQSSGWVVHSFVLMNNHYHLLIETLRPMLVKGMQYLNSTYTRRYNVRYKTFGHLFQGRYKALLVDVEARGYFLTVSDYIHMNLVRAKKVGELKDLLEHSWCSAGWLAGNRKRKPKWLGWERVYGELGMSRWSSRFRREYREYLARRILELQEQGEAWKKIRRGWCFGAAEFVAKMKECLEELSKKPRDEESWNDLAVEELEQQRAFSLLQKGAKVLGYANIKEIHGWDRLLLARWVRQHSKASVKWLASELGMKTRGGMSNGIYLVGRRINRDRRTAQKWNQLLK